MNIGFVTNMLSSWWRLLKTDKNNICVICLCSSLIIQNYWIFTSLCKFCIHTSDIFRPFYKTSMSSFLHNVHIRLTIYILMMCLVFIFFSLQSKKILCQSSFMFHVEKRKFKSKRYFAATVCWKCFVVSLNELYVYKAKHEVQLPW